MDKGENFKIPYVDNVFYKLDQTARVAELMARNCYKMYQDTDKPILDLDEFKIISHIMDDPDLSQSDIAKLVYKGKAHVGKILNELEKKHYIKRDLTTRNNIIIKHTIITEKGKEIYFYTDERFKEINQNIKKMFSEEELSSLKALLDKLKIAMLNNNKISF